MALTCVQMYVRNYKKHPPFFPKSNRRVPQVVQPTIASNPVSAFPQIANAIALKGISGLPGKRLAMHGR